MDVYVEEYTPANTDLRGYYLKQPRGVGALAVAAPGGRGHYDFAHLPTAPQMVGVLQEAQVAMACFEGGGAGGGGAGGGAAGGLLGAG
eukprot:3048171-Pyramimonas_sp.AAC.1